jgi:hypothetical protein
MVLVASWNLESGARSVKNVQESQCNPTVNRSIAEAGGFPTARMKFRSAAKADAVVFS